MLKITTAQTITVILSIIGSITGITSLVIQIGNYLLAKPKIDVMLDDIFDSFWIEGHKLNLLSDDSKPINGIVEHCDVAVFSLKIVNRRNIPVTLESFYYNNKPIQIEFEFYPPMKTFDFGPEGIHKYPAAISNNKNFPIKLNGYDVVKISLYFVVNKSSKLDPRQFNLELKTPYKTYPFSFELKHFEEYMSHKSLGMIKAGIIAKKQELEQQQ